jgi:hypothetical protein
MSLLLCIASTSAKENQVCWTFYREIPTTKQELMMASLDSRGRLIVVEAASQIGRRWLDVIPTSSRFLLSDNDVRANLHIRTLAPGYGGPCKRCANANVASHDEACPGRKDFRVSRHEAVKHALAAGLTTIKGMSVEVEPFLPDLRRRNDIRVKLDTDDRRGVVNEEYDLMIMVLSASANQRALAVRSPPSDISLFKQSFDRIQSVLAQGALKKVNNIPASDPGQPPPAPFSPLVLSSGGVMERGMFEKLRAWKSFGMNSVDHAWTLSSVAISLARARGRTFMV